MQTRQNMNFLLFFVQLVTLRYMGYRQQSLVNCVIGENIFFNSDKSITLHFDVTKNNKRIHMDLTENRRYSHSMLLDTLNLFYRKVYPFILRHSEDLKGQFFVSPSGHKQGFRSFKGETDFGNFFKRGVTKFLGVDLLPLNLQHEIHPHFFRGLCIDWMKTDLHMTNEEIAEVIGDDPATLNTYVDKNRVYDAGAAFDIGIARTQALQREQNINARQEEMLDKIEKIYMTIEVKDKEIARLHSVQAQLVNEISLLNKQLAARV